MRPAIKIKNIKVNLGKNFFALKDVNLEFQTGKITGLIGPSGAGKTTLMRCIVGRQKITSGSIEILGTEAGSKKLRAEVSYMTQNVSIYNDLTVKQNLAYFSTMQGMSGRAKKQVVDKIIETLDLNKNVNQIASSLSGGQRQRLSLAVALIGYKPIMILDEPTVGLDPVLREQMWELFRKLASEGKTILISSHVMDEAERCDDLVLVRDGKIIAHETPRELCLKTESKNVEESFLKLVGAL